MSKTPTFVLGLDLDGVCADYTTYFRRHVAKVLGVKPSTLGPQTHWSFVNSGWLRTEDQFTEMHRGAVLNGMFRKMPMIPGASEQLWRLSDEEVYIRIITHRLCINGHHGKAAGDTVHWLEKNNIPFRDLCFVADKPQVGADVYVDDAPHNIAKLRAAGGYAIVFDADYNRHVEGPRARNWEEAAELILARKALVEAGKVPSVAA
jgi:5'(3')-deoxyribonucleotidase